MLSNVNQNNTHDARYTGIKLKRGQSLHKLRLYRSFIVNYSFKNKI